jgi:hypothetical protein
MITELLEEMVAVLNAAKEDAVKFEEKGNAASGRRVRVAMQDLKKKAQDVRVAVTEAKKK